MFIVLYLGNEIPLLEWEYTPPIGPRPVRGFVGLKNAGATCYMNSVIQQVCLLIQREKSCCTELDGSVNERPEGCSKFHIFLKIMLRRI